MPAALGGVIDEDVARRLRTRVIVEAANGPTLPEAQPVLDERGIVVGARHPRQRRRRDRVATSSGRRAGRATRGTTARSPSGCGTRWTSAFNDGVGAMRRRSASASAGAASVVAVERVAEAIEARGLFP